MEFINFHYISTCLNCLWQLCCPFPNFRNWKQKEKSLWELYHQPASPLFISPWWHLSVRKSQFYHIVLFYYLCYFFFFFVQGKEMTQGVLTTQMKYWKAFASGVVEVFKNLRLTYYKCNMPTVVAFTQFTEAGGWIIDAVYSLTRYLFVLPVWRSVGLSNLSPSISYAGVVRAAWLARSWLSALSYTDSSGKSPSLLQQLPVSSVILQHVVSTAT